MNNGEMSSAYPGLSVPDVRSLAMIEAELDLLEQDTRRKETALIENYIEVGRRLEEAKAQLPHGEWGLWLEKRGYPQAKAVKLMKIFRAYGQEQQSLFGSGAKSKALENLGFQKLVQLLAIGNEEERERFVEEHQVADMSTRELERALRERDAALRRAEESENEARAAEEARQKMAEDMRLLNEVAGARRAEAQAAGEEHARLLSELEDLRERTAGSADAAAQARKAAIEEMTGKVNKAKEAKKKAEDKCKEAEAALAAAQKELAGLKARGPQVRELTPEEVQAITAGEVEKARAAATERMQALEKQLAQADPDTAAFKVLFTSWQETYGKMMEALERVRAADGGKAEKLLRAVRAAMEGMNCI